ncbi:DUF177 domain-containing protein [Chloroflexota bacterium]
MVEINVSQQLKEPIGSTRNYEVSDTVDIDGTDNIVQGLISLTRTDRGILTKGTLHTQSKLTCSRCLSEFDYPLTLNIEEEYFPSIDIMSGTPLPSPEEPGTFTINENNVLDLAEAIRQYAVMAIPMKPLCQKDCAGLCPTCGVNLNKASCNCPTSPTDSRWAKLSKLVLANAEAPAEEQKGTK